MISEILLLHSQWDRHRACSSDGGLLAGKCLGTCLRGPEGTVFVLRPKGEKEGSTLKFNAQNRDGCIGRQKNSMNLKEKGRDPP